MEQPPRRRGRTHATASATSRGWMRWPFGMPPTCAARAAAGHAVKAHGGGHWGGPLRGRGHGGDRGCEQRPATSSPPRGRPRRRRRHHPRRRRRRPRGPCLDAPGPTRKRPVGTSRLLPPTPPNARPRRDRRGERWHSADVGAPARRPEGAAAVGGEVPDRAGAGPHTQDGQGRGDAWDGTDHGVGG